MPSSPKKKNTKKVVEQKEQDISIFNIHTHVKMYQLVLFLLVINIIAFFLVVNAVYKVSAVNLPEKNIPYLPITSLPNVPKGIDTLNASAAAYVVFDSDSRIVLAGKNQNLRFSPASAAKIMSALIVLKSYGLDQYLTVPSNIYSIEGSKMNLVPNEKITVMNLLYGLMLPSGNDAAYTLSYYYPSGVEGFVSKMNEEAQALGLKNTKFADPAGYDDSNYTTASELARLAAHAMQNEVFAQIVGTREALVYDQNGVIAHPLKNLNELLVYPNVKGVKTGFTNEAGGVLVTALEENEKTFIVVVLKSPDRFSDTQDIMQFITEKIKYAFPPGEVSY